MTEDSVDADICGARRPYVKPVVRSLDVSDTEGKTVLYPSEHIGTFHNFGPS